MDTQSKQNINRTFIKLSRRCTNSWYTVNMVQYLVIMFNMKLIVKDKLIFAKTKLKRKVLFLCGTLILRLH